MNRSEGPDSPPPKKGRKKKGIGLVVDIMDMGMGMEITAFVHVYADDKAGKLGSL